MLCSVDSRWESYEGNNEELCPGTARGAGLGVASWLLFSLTLGPSPEHVGWCLCLEEERVLLTRTWAVGCRLALAGGWSLGTLTPKSRRSWEAVQHCSSVTSCPETAGLAEGPVLLAKVTELC